ncbi:hypothetical protein CERSUDRAFT_149887 [Gelatoporia subvermispora B]|uniref:Uncharacterized protein n=1 Tax=Ceriporiopsis subvermispora (strain B) TaxID=914234 RepID=M2PWG2_CERS8|nr:hypothetical protein CERSUDRAFT_149887 [Gelatoporia subvermispora B]
MAETEASKVYSEQLFTKGHGLPLWDPTPPEELGEVQIGDVGYIWRGAFHRLFNAMHEADQEINRRYGVPEGFTKFNLQESRSSVHRRPNAIPSGFLCSKSISRDQIAIQGSATTPANVGAGVGASFACQDEHGAVLWMRDPADREELHSSRRMANYMGKNWKKWHTFATDDVDVDIPKDGIYFIRGWVKTKQWAVAAVVREGRSRSFSLTGNVSAAGLSINFDQSREIQGNIEFNQGPPLRGAPSPYPSITDGQQSVPLPQYHYEVPRTQAIFLHYYKLKPRSMWVWKPKIQAAAEPRDPEADRDGHHPTAVGADTPESEQDEVDIVDDIQMRGFDPLDYLLDYILMHSAADVAIANDGDLSALCEGQEIPDDIPGLLEQRMPSVEVTEDGYTLPVGMLEDFSTQPIEIGGAESAEQNLPEDPIKEGDPVADEEPRRESSESVEAIVLTDEEHENLGITWMEYSRDSRYLATALEDHSITIWDPINQRRVSSCQGHTDHIYAIAFSARASEMVSGAGDGQAIVWDTINGVDRLRLRGHEGVIWSVAYSHDGRTIATGSVDFTIRLWDSESGSAKATCRGHTAVILFVSFSPDGRYLASGSSDYTARIWNPSSGTELTLLRAHTGVVWQAAFSADSVRIVTGSDDGTCRVWNVLTGEELLTLREHTGPVWNVGFTPDGAWVFSASNDSTIKIWDSYSGDCIRTLEGYDIAVNTAAFSSSGARIASTFGNEVKVWDSASGDCLATLQGHSDTVTNLRFSPDGRYLASSADDFSVRIWNLRDNFLT